MAAEVLVGAERRVLISGYGALPTPPPPDSLLGRLDQIDLRLRQLEDQRRPSDDVDGEVSCFATDSDSRRGGPPRHQHSKSMPSALQQQQQQANVLRGSLMDRLNLLESRIRQLSCELDLDGGVSGKAASLAALSVEDRAWSEPPLPEPRGGDVPAASVRARAAAPAAAAGASWSAVQILQKGARQLHRNKPNHPAKAKKLKEAKCACEEEKRKAERGNKQPSASRRWFAIGC